MRKHNDLGRVAALAVALRLVIEEANAADSGSGILPGICASGEGGLYVRASAALEEIDPGACAAWVAEGAWPAPPPADPAGAARRVLIVAALGEVADARAEFEEARCVLHAARADFRRERDTHTGVALDCAEMGRDHAEDELMAREAVLAVRQARTLPALAEALNALVEVTGGALDEWIDTQKLQSWGGVDRSDAMGVWSWSETRRLVCNHDAALEEGRWFTQIWCPGCESWEHATRSVADRECGICGEPVSPSEDAIPPEDKWGIDRRGDSW